MNLLHWRELRISKNVSAVAWVILGASVLRLVLAASTPLTPQEAYYWTWSRFPDWSYFDHPPLASHAIGLTTLVLGQTAFGIKCAAVLWSVGWNVMWARLIPAMFRNPKLTFWSLLCLNLTLLYELYGFGPTPDGPLLFGWIGTIWAVWRAGQTGRGGWWYAAGAFLGIACLGKYSGVLLVPVIGLYLLADPSQRRWLLRPQPYIGLVIAAIAFAPVVIWNARHDWVSLTFQSTRRFEEMGGLKPRFFAVLVVTQFLLLTPYPFLMSIGALWRHARAWAAGRIRPQELLLLSSALIPLLVFTVASFRTNAKINWLLPAWWSLIVLGMHHALSVGGTGRWRTIGLSISGVLLALGIGASVIPNLPLPGDLNIWSGWHVAAERVDRLVADERAQGRRAFVFSPNYKISSLIWFHRPTQERTYAQDIVGRRALQYDFFPKSEDLRGATGFLVLSDQAQSAVDMNAVRASFETLKLAETVDVGAFGRSTRRVEIWRGTGYRDRPAPGPAQGPQDASP